MGKIIDDDDVNNKSTLLRILLLICFQRCIAILNKKVAIVDAVLIIIA